MKLSKILIQFFTVLFILILIVPQGTYSHPLSNYHTWVERRIAVKSVGEPWWEESVFDRNHDGIADTIDGDGDYPYFLISFKRKINNNDLDYIRSFGLNVGNVYSDIETVEVKGPTMNVLKLAEKDFVAVIFPPGRVVFDSNIACPNAKVRDSKIYSPDTAWDLGYKGDGVPIAIMDTGVDDSHPSLKGKWLAGVDFTKPDTPLTPRDGSYNPDDVHGHGTTCAGIAMGTGAPEGIYMGAAPQARLVEVRIGTRIGYAPGELYQDFYDATLKGLQWIGEHKDSKWSGAGEKWRGIKVVSISWGIDVGYHSDGTDPYSRMEDSLVRKGLVVSNAAGNEGPNNNGFQGLSASTLSIIVAASDDRDTIDRGDDLLAWYSSRGPRTDNGNSDPYDELRPDVTAPGTNITQAAYQKHGDGSGGGYGPRGSGTSYSTPLVAGLTGLIHQANPDLNPLEIREILRATAQRRGNATYPKIDPFWNRNWGWGLVDGGKAIKMAEMTSEIKNLNINLQCFITNTTHIPEKGTLVKGVAWNRYGEVDGVMWRVEDGVWKRIKRNTTGYLNFSILIPPGEGNITLEVRGYKGDGESLPFTEEVKRVKPVKSYISIKGKEFGLITGILLLSMIIVYIFRKKIR